MNPNKTGLNCTKCKLNTVTEGTLCNNCLRIHDQLRMISEEHQSIPEPFKQLVLMHLKLVNLVGLSNEKETERVINDSYNSIITIMEHLKK